MVSGGAERVGRVELADLDALLAGREVLLVVGPGGVGKTTLTAALGIRAAVEHGRRVLVVTVDPARRLADAMGVDELRADPVLVSLGVSDDDERDDGAGDTGVLWASMVEMARSWDELVHKLAPPDDARALIANPLYRTLTTRFAKSHDYIALDHLNDLADDDRYDLVVIDTPPSSHAIDILDAPDRMIQFFESRWLWWLTAPYRNPMAQVAAGPFLGIAERLLGGPFLARIAEFFWLFSKIRTGMIERAGEVGRRLADPDTAYVAVTTGDPAALAQATALIDGLDERSHQLALILHNRAVPRAGVDTDGAAGLADPGLRRAVETMLGRDRTVVSALGTRETGSVGVLAVPWQQGDLGTIAALRRLLGPGGD